MSIARRLERPNLRAIAVLLITSLLTLWPIRAAFAVNGSVVYTYDALGRIITASYDTGVCVIYTYDANGNRLSETVNVNGSGSTGVWGCFNWSKANWGP
jgi:YD repeat-containing protein